MLRSLRSLRHRGLVRSCSTDKMVTMSQGRADSVVRVRGQARSTAWNKLIFLGLVLSAIAVQVIVGGRAGSLVSVPVMLLVYIAGQLALGPRSIEASAHEVTLRANGRHGRVLAVAAAKDVTLVRSGRCRIEARGTTVWFQGRDWQRLANTLAD